MKPAKGCQTKDYIFGTHRGSKANQDQARRSEGDAVSEHSAQFTELLFRECLAFNSNIGQPYVFECKRGHGAFDDDKIRAIDQRLDKVTASIGAHVASKGWRPSSTGTFILSFYGATWKSAYPIHDQHSVSSPFEPCVGRFVVDYMEHLETTTSNAFSSELRDTVDVPVGETIFDLITEDREKPWPDVLFTEDGADFVYAHQNS